MWPSLWTSILPGISGQQPTAPTAGGTQPNATGPGGGVGATPPGSGPGSGGVGASAGTSLPPNPFTDPVGYMNWVFNQGVATSANIQNPGGSDTFSLFPGGPTFSRKEATKIAIAVPLYIVLAIAIANFIRPGTSHDVIVAGGKAAGALAE